MNAVFFAVVGMAAAACAGRAMKRGEWGWAGLLVFVAAMELVALAALLAGTAA